jgi:hypothetical protein
MRRAPAPPVDLGPYFKAVPLLLRNPSIIVIPLLMAVIGVLVGMTFSPYGIVGTVTSGLAGLIVTLLQLFGLGAACIIADDAWRRGRASFDNGWSEARRRGGDLLYAAIGVTFIVAIAQFTATIFGGLVAYVLMAVAAVFMIWVMPAAAVGGVPGAAAIQISIDRVRANPLAAALAAIVAVALVFVLPPFLAVTIALRLLPYTGSMIVVSLLIALIQAIATGYVALVLTKTYTDAAFGRRW